MLNTKFTYDACEFPWYSAGDNIVLVGAAGDLSSLFKKPAGIWDCPTCFIQNKEEVNKCVACCTSKPCSTTTSDSAVKVR